MPGHRVGLGFTQALSLRARFIVRSDHAALRWMLLMDGAYGRLARWRLRHAEFNNVMESSPGQHQHAADVMSRLVTSGADRGPIPEEIPTLLTLANFASAWVQPSFKSDKRYPPMTIQRILEA